MNRRFLLFAIVVTISWCVVAATSIAQIAPAAGEARLTLVSNQVQLLHNTNAVGRASMNDVVDAGAVVRTGKKSRAELTFSDETAVRLAANTAFSFKSGTRDLNLCEGAVLVQTPRTARGATIHAGKVAAAISGTTVMVEYHPGVCKFLVLEGTGRLYRPGHLGDSVLVGPGQIVMGNPNASLSDPATFDILGFVKTSRLMTDFPPLRSEKMILTETQKQQREKSKKSLVETNLVIFGGGTRVSLIDQTGAKAAPNGSPEANGPSH